MKITKFSHCCLLLELPSLTILTDPGVFSDAQDALTGIDIVLITHEHADHVHTESVMRIMEKNPDAEVISNAAVHDLLAAAGIKCTVVDGRSSIERKGIAIEAFDGAHAEIFEQVGQVQNTGYYIDGSFFIPGDSFANAPGKPVDILALPVSGPWCRIPDAIRFCLAIAPKRAIPIHDAMLKPDEAGWLHGMTQRILSSHSIDFVPMGDGDRKEF